MNIHDALSPPVSMPSGAEASAPRDREKLAQAAQGFESILLTRLLNEMKETIGKWGMEKDSSTQQIQGLFWMQLAENLADQGGIGLGRQMIDSFEASADTNANTELDTAL